MEEGGEGEIEYKSIVYRKIKLEICYIKIVVKHTFLSHLPPSPKGRFKVN